MIGLEVRALPDQTPSLTLSSPSRAPTRSLKGLVSARTGRNPARKGSTARVQPEVTADIAQSTTLRLVHRLLTVAARHLASNRLFNSDLTLQKSPAGKEDAMGERFGVADKVAQQPQQIIRPVIQRIIEPRNIVSYARMKPHYAERPRIIEPPRYINDHHVVDDLRSVEDNFIINRQRQAEEYIGRNDFNRRELDQREIEGGELERRRLDRRTIELDRRQLDFERRPLEPRPHLLDRRFSDFERRPLERPKLFERRHSEIRLEYARPIEARQDYFDHRSPIERYFSRRRSPPKVAPRDSHPFAPTAPPRHYSPSTSSLDGW
ncbi:hypothetical protein LZ554_004458 [Drepanopeziza brunnea f. sp. 'monogermtubi']|nr:hypothetical protein LZ554_004458 [Drepanopeziza brunnea f. sp. 'monogermtubi']